MISDTVKYSSVPTISDNKKMGDDHPQNNSESSALTSDISFVRNSTNIIFIKKNTSIPITDGFFTRVWRCFQTSDGKHSNGNLCDEGDTELAEILTHGENLRQQVNSLCNPDSEAPVPHGWRGSMLKRCLVGAGLLTGTGVLDGMGYAGYKYSNHGTSSIEKSRYTIQETSGSLEDSFGNHAPYHDGAANKLRHHRRHLSNTTESGLIDNGGDKFFNNTLNKINHRIINLLYQEGLLLDKRSKYKEKIFYALSRYLHYGEIIHTENKIKILAQKILHGSGIYGEKSKEQLSSEQAKSVMRYWVFQNILSTTPEKYIESKMKLDIAKVYTVNDIHSLFSVDNLPVMNHFQLDRLTQIEQSSFHIMWKEFLLEEMPFLAFGDKKIKSILLNDSDFANLYSGSRFIKNIEREEFSFEHFSSEDIMVVGESMWKLATIEGVPEDKLAYYFMPALLFNASSSEDVKNKLEDDIYIVNNYLNYRENINSVASDIKNKSNIYFSAATSWLTKGRLADKIIEECANDLKSDIFSDVSIGRTAQQNYLDSIMKPCDNAPDNLDDEYTKQTAYVADSFREIDKYLMLPAFGLLPADEKAFISAPNAIIHMAKVLVNSNYFTRFIRNGNPNKEIIAPLKNTVIFTVQQDKQERIYALKEIKSHQEYYKLIRLDRNIKDYLKNDIFDDEFIHKHNAPGFFSGDLKYIYYMFFHFDRYSFNTVFKIDKETILIKQDNISSLIDSLSDIHRMTLFNDLYQFGNDPSDSQKVWNIAKHLIPFYDCTNDIIEENIAAATIECTLDAMLFIPVLAQATKLSVKFGTGLTRGLNKGMASVVAGQGAEVAVNTLLREVSLPATVELASLGKNTLIALDPGFSILMSTALISRTFAKKIVKLISEKKAMTTLVASLKTRIAKLPLITPNKSVTGVGVLAGTKLEIPVVAVGKQHGENIYVKMNPKTGEKLGTKYICRGEGVLLPVSSLSGRHKRSEDDTYMSRLVNNTHNNYNRVKRMDNNRLRCLPPLTISPGSRNAINSYPRVINIENIPQQERFLTRYITHPYNARYSTATLGDFSADTSRAGEVIKMSIRRIYQSESFFSFRLSQNPSTIPRQYARLISHLPHCRTAVDNAKRLINSLDNHFLNMDLERMPSSSIYARRIENYLSPFLQLDTIADINIQNIIKKESIARLKEYIRRMKFFFDTEIDNIYFVTANRSPHIFNENAYIDKIGGFMNHNDKYRRVIIMVDIFMEGELYNKLHTTILHEVSHLAGSLDYYVTGGTSVADNMRGFNNAALGGGEGSISFGDDVMEYYQHTTRRRISKEQLMQLIRRDPVLRANIFMDNAYFLPTMIEALAQLPVLEV